ncbi:MAG: SUMO ligase siz1 [Thelocarpon superellum]|nr:MAG: SUMO ligase siz1 [Thelocarpon superellum]
MASSVPLDARQHVARVKLLLNKHLVSVLKEERLQHTGVKAAMQARLISRIEEYARRHDTESLRRLGNNILNADSLITPTSSKYGQDSPGTPSSPSHTAMSKGPSRGYPQSNGGSAHGSSFSPMTAHLIFKESPFETVLEPVTPVQTCPAMNNHRHSVSTALRLTRAVIERVKADPAIRLMVYCGAESSMGMFSKLDIAFPHQVELKVNQDDVKANLRGLKNKSGSTRPADITSFLHKVEKYENTVSLTYALTHKRYCFVVNLVRTHSVTELVGQLSARRAISKESVIREMVAKAQDTDLIATSTVMSLKCPLSTLRMDLPCRSTVCTHIQCFDATSFLQLQQQAPTWTCPICNKIVSFEALAVDQYVHDILKATPRSTEQVTIEPTGDWSQSKPQSSSSYTNGNGGHHDDDEDDDDDIVEIRDTKVGSFKQEASTTPNNSFLSSASAPASGISQRSSSNKRPMSKVIDLTLSDSDDEPPRPPKRQQVRAPPSALPPALDGYQSATSSGSGNRPNGITFRLHGVHTRPSSSTDHAFR